MEILIYFSCDLKELLLFPMAWVDFFRWCFKKKKKDLIYLLLERGEKRKKERERNITQLQQGTWDATQEIKGRAYKKEQREFLEQDSG